MTLEPASDIDQIWLGNETSWKTGLLTKYGIQGNESIIRDVDATGGDINTLRQFDHEAKHIGLTVKSFHIKTGALVQNKIEQINNKNKKFVLWGYLDHRQNRPNDPVYVKDIGEIISDYSIGQIFEKFPNGLDIFPCDCTYTHRQDYNELHNDYLKGRTNSLDLQSIRRTKTTALDKYFWD